MGEGAVRAEREREKRREEHIHFLRCAQRCSRACADICSLREGERNDLKWLVGETCKACKNAIVRKTQRREKERERDSLREGGREREILFDVFAKSLFVYRNTFTSYDPYSCAEELALVSASAGICTCFVTQLVKTCGQRDSLLCTMLPLGARGRGLNPPPPSCCPHRHQRTPPARACPPPHRRRRRC